MKVPITKRIGGLLLSIMWPVFWFSLLVGAISTINWWRDPVRHLRTYASEVHDYTPPDFSFTGDFTRFIRADCSEMDFHRFAREEGLTTRLTEDNPRGVMFWPSCDQPWWTSPTSYSGAYYSFREGGECRIMQYSNGHLYYVIIVW